VTLSESESVTAEFTPMAREELTLNKEGSGAGIVKSLPSSFLCGISCTAQTSSFTEGTVVMLTASPAKGSVFTGWTGACAGTGSCVVTPSEATTVGAAFALIEDKLAGQAKALTVAKAEGTGTGTVGTYPGGIVCYGGCTEQSAKFKEGIIVTLKATPGRDSTFTEWGGACSGSGSCEVTLSEAQLVTAQFTALPIKTLTLGKAGEGTGVVVGKPSFGITCRQTCTTTTAFFPQTTTVALNPILGRGAGSLQWTGCDNAEGVQCIVAISSDKTITAKFE
jgi:Fe-S cluster biogenesis protein NfuA